jgi:hypothetical protein
MKLVKYYVWEKFFEDKIMNIRAKEQKLAFRTAVIKTINVAMVFAVPPTTAYVIFTAYEFGEKRLVASIAFTTLSLFNILRFPLVVLPKALRAASEGLTSLRRIEDFLSTEVEAKDKDVGTPGIRIVRSHQNQMCFTTHVPPFCMLPKLAFVRMMPCFIHQLLTGRSLLFYFPVSSTVESLPVRCQYVASFFLPVRCLTPRPPAGWWPLPVRGPPRG